MKILIWDIFPLENIGGPMGYLYNLHEYLNVHPNSQITFLSDLIREKEGTVAEWYNPVSKNNKPSKTYLGKLFRRLKDVYIKCLFPFRKTKYQIPSSIDINYYEYVHLHMVPHALQFRKQFPHYNGKVILTTHCPCTWTDEILSYTASATSKLNKITKFLRPIILQEECQAYQSVDYIMFPCKGAREPYQRDPKVSALFESIENKFFYVPSSLPDYNIDNSTQQKISEFGIPQDAFIIAFFGRHTSIKGYDILKEVGVRLLEEYPYLYFLCAGNGNIQPPKHPRWIELGFIRNVDDILPQSNLYILPNRETYFDLIALQVLRAGVPMVLSETGGNKYFAILPEDERRGLLFYKSEDKDLLTAMVKKIVDLYNFNSNEYNEMRQKNRFLYETYFTIDKYVMDYIDAVENLK